MLVPLTVLVLVLLTTIPTSHSGKNCPIKYHGISGHSACLPPSKNIGAKGFDNKPPEYDLTSIDRDIILEKHNKIRSQVKPYACRMNKLYWDNDLAYVAQKWASNCKFSHDQQWQRHIPGKFSSGQNIAVGLGSWREAIDSWYKESEKFTYGGDNAVGVVRNYVQMVKETISRIGCGFAECSNTAGRFFVCNYAPGPLKNEDVQNPYEVCSKAFPLKDCKGLTCMNGGIMYENTCSCRCTQEDITYGKACELNCSIAEDPCPCEIKYTTTDCSKDVNVRYVCPLLCGICPYFILTDSGMKHSVEVTWLAFSVAIFHFVHLSTD